MIVPSNQKMAKVDVYRTCGLFFQASPQFNASATSSAKRTKMKWTYLYISGISGPLGLYLASFDPTPRHQTSGGFAPTSRLVLDTAMNLGARLVHLYAEHPAPMECLDVYSSCGVAQVTGVLN